MRFVNFRKNFSESNIDFVSNRKKFFIFSAILSILGVVVLLAFGLNLGIDFVSGTRLDVYLDQSFNEDKVQSVMEPFGYHPTIRAGGQNNDMAIIRFNESLDKDKVEEIRDAFKTEFGDKVDLQESKVNPDVARGLAKNAILAVLYASIGIIIYVTIRFEWRFAIAAVLALLHDAFLVITLFSIFRLEVDVVFIAAMLTIVGYSINDTIVIFDRIRENMKHAKIKTFADIEKVVNSSLLQTLSRSINTVLTVLFATIALYIFAGEAMRNFSIALLIGLVFGAYSSIFIASQIWLELKKKEFNNKRKRPVPSTTTES